MGNHRRLWIFSLGPLVFSYCQCLVRYLPFEDFDLSTPGEWLRFKVMVFYATLNNISVISWQSVLLVEEIGGLGENHRPVASHWQTLSHNVVYLALIEIRIHKISGGRH